MQLENSQLIVELYADRPAVQCYEHKTTGSKFNGASKEGILVINGVSMKWKQWRIQVKHDAAQIVYGMSLPGEKLSFKCVFTLKDNALVMELRDIEDPLKKLKSIGWNNLPLLTCDDPEYSYWRLGTLHPDEETGRKMWLKDTSGQIKSSTLENTPIPVIYGTLYRPDKLCASVFTNYPLFPVTHQLIEKNHYAISLNTYHYRIRSKIMVPLRAQVVFIEDLNGDGLTDLNDYRLWVNRQLADADPIYRKSIWYKIFCDYRSIGVKTTFKQAEKIIKAIYNITDGLPQIVYLVGWQSGGHDADYPSFDTVNEQLAGSKTLRELFQVCKNQFNTTLSYHANIDDAYKDSKDWDDDIMGTFGICHTRDVESGKIFKRLAAMMKTVPVEKTIHFDNMRVTNCIPTQDPEGIGILEEVVCGLQPIMEFLRSKGITVTTEGQNGMPIDCSTLVSGLWHYDLCNAEQIFHRKLIGGGRGDHYGTPNFVDYGLGSSIHQDFSYEPAEHIVCYKDRWSGLEQGIVSRIYLGTLLYHFYLEHEMTKWGLILGGIRVQYDKDIVVEVSINKGLKVTWGDVLVAQGYDRFIPRGDAIYAYSRYGCKRTWVLPESFKGANIQVFSLSKAGRGPAPKYRLEKDKIWMELTPDVPVKLVRKLV